MFSGIASSTAWCQDQPIVQGPVVAHLGTSSGRLTHGTVGISWRTRDATRRSSCTYRERLESPPRWSRPCVGMVTRRARDDLRELDPPAIGRRTRHHMQMKRDGWAQLSPRRQPRRHAPGVAMASTSPSARVVRLRQLARGGRCLWSFFSSCTLTRSFYGSRMLVIVSTKETPELTPPTRTAT